MHSGYMLFIRIFSRIWNSDYNKLIKWGLITEYNRPFLGIAAHLWNMLHDEQKNRWNELALNDYYNVNKVKYSALDREVLYHIRLVLGKKLITKPLN